MMPTKLSLVSLVVTSSTVFLLFIGAGCMPAETTVTTNSTTNVITTPEVTQPTVTGEAVVIPSTWSIFTSPLMDYTIDYPPTWNTWSGSERYEDMGYTETDVDYFSIVPAEDSFTIDPDQILIAIDLDTKQQLVPGEDAIEDLNDVIAANSQEENVSKVQALVVDGNLPAVQQVEQDPDDTTDEYGYNMVTYIDADAVVYTIYVTTASEADYERYADIIQTMIASFHRQ